MSHYSTITADQIETGTDEAIDEARAVLDELVAPKDARTFDNSLRPLDRIGDILAHAFTDYAFMGYVHVDKDVRDAAKIAEEKSNQFGVEMIFRDDLNTAIQEYAATDEAASLEGEQARFLEFTLRDLRKAGHDLDPESRSTVKEKTERLVSLGVKFQQNIDEWDDWILVTRDELDGLPDSFIDALDIDEATEKYKVTIAYPHLIPFTENATHSRAPRRAAIQVQHPSCGRKQTVTRRSGGLATRNRLGIRDAYMVASSSRGADGQEP